MQETGFHPRVEKIPWRRKWQPTPEFFPGESHGQRSLEGYSSWGHKESDTTEGLTHMQGEGWDTEVQLESHVWSIAAQSGNWEVRWNNVCEAFHQHHSQNRFWTSEVQHEKFRQSKWLPYQLRNRFSYLPCQGLPGLLDPDRCLIGWEPQETSVCLSCAAWDLGNRSLPLPFETGAVPLLMTCFFAGWAWPRGALYGQLTCICSTLPCWSYLQTDRLSWTP